MNRLRLPTAVFHIVAWLIFVSLPLLFLLSGSDRDHILTPGMAFNGIVFLSVYILVFYLHSWWIFPLLFQRKKYFLYALALLGLLLLVAVVRPFDRLLAQGERSGTPAAAAQFPPPSPGDRPGEPGGFPPPPPGSSPGDQPGGRPPAPRSARPAPPGYGFDVVSFFLFALILIFSFADQSARQWRLAEERAVRAEADKANAELSFLKAQVNPHFLFNTLNNIYTLAVKQSDAVPDSLMKLSNIMRYITDEAGEDRVPLEDEVANLRDYVDLQRLRVGSQTPVDLRVSGPVEHHRIAPLLFMPFVENVFKYGVSNHEPSPIAIQIVAGEQTVTFFAENRVFAGRAEAGTSRTGIGIENTRRRLAYLYPDNHFLSVENRDGKFTVRLTLRT